MRDRSPVANRRMVLGGLAGALVMPRRRAVAALPARLEGPVAVEVRRGLLGRPLSGFSCQAVPPPVIDLSVEGAYIDPAFSVIDPAKFQKMMEITRPLGAFTARLAELSDVSMMTRPARPEPAHCVLAWLDGWASAGALLGRLDTPDAQHQRRWNLCGMGLAYLKIRDVPGLDVLAKDRVERWFGRLAEQATAYYGRFKRADYNNHTDWWALSLAVTGVATNDRGMFDHALGLYDQLTEDIQPDGELPREMLRKGRAYGYHLFALTALVMIAEIGHANGLDLYGAHGGAIHRLARRVLDGIIDASWFAARAGVAQDAVDPKKRSFDYCWAEIYNGRFPDPAVAQRIQPFRPIFYNWLGGNVTYDFGSPTLPLRS